jgi:hypothetical protein
MYHSKKERIIDWARNHSGRRGPDKPLMTLNAGLTPASHKHLTKVKPGTRLGRHLTLVRWARIPCGLITSVSMLEGRSSAGGRRQWAEVGLTTGAYRFTFESDGERFSAVYCCWEHGGKFEPMAIVVVPFGRVQAWFQFQLHMDGLFAMRPSRRKAYVVGSSTSSDFRPSVRLPDVILPDSLKADIVASVDQFFASGLATYVAMKVPPFRKYMLYGQPGNGKCLGKDTPVLMADGTLRKVQDVKQGELVMGPDSLPRRVLGTTQGIGDLFRVVPVKGEPYVVNRAHVLSLKLNANVGGFQKGASVDMPLVEYLGASEGFRKRAKGYRVGVDFPERPVGLEPYFLGLWLGDGNSRGPQVTTADAEVAEYLGGYCERMGLRLKTLLQRRGKAQTYCLTGPKDPRRGSNPILARLQALGLLQNKHIPHAYKANSREVRLQVLAGLIDSDGSTNCGGYDYITKSEQLADDVVYLCRTLGLAAYKAKTRKSIKSIGFSGEYYRILISGDVSMVPVRLQRKKCAPRLPVKDVLVTGLHVEPLGPGEYFGFQVDRDGRFVLGDFTVTHNSMLCQALAADQLGKGRVVVYISASDSYGASFSKIQQATAVAARQRFPIFVIVEEIDAYVAHESDQAQILDFLDGFEAPVNARGTVLMATTNHPERLEDRILRFGRMDRRWLVPPILDVDDARRLLEHFLGELYRAETSSQLEEALIGKPRVFVRELSLTARLRAAASGEARLNGHLVEALHALEQQIQAGEDFLREGRADMQFKPDRRSAAASLRADEFPF